MKKWWLVVACIAAAMQCGQFPTRYDRIETDKIRPIGLVYTPFAEGAPGDTIVVRAYFGGKKIVSTSVQMSYNVVTSINSQNPVILDVFNLPTTSLTQHLPDSMDFAFAVPESTCYETKGISQSNINGLKRQIPPSMGSMTQKDFAGFLADLGAIQAGNPLSLQTFLQKWGAVTDITTADPAGVDSLAMIGGKIVTAFAVPAVIYVNMTADDGSTLRMQGEFTIRYNRRFNALFPGLVLVNNNPALRWIGAYAVKGRDVSNFRPEDTTFHYSLTYFHYQPLPYLPDSIADTLLIDTGRTYFLAADSGMMTYSVKSGTRLAAAVNGFDTTWRILGVDTSITDTVRDKIFYYSAGRRTFELETFFYDWEYENLDLDSVRMPEDSLFMFSPGSTAGGGGEPSIMKMLPPLDTRLTHVRVWVTVYDQAISDYNRPAGFAIRPLDIYFKYSPAYLAAHH